MNPNKRIFTAISIFLLLGVTACKKQLNVGDPNDPNLTANASDEGGVIQLASGGVYLNGFQNGDGWLGNSYFSLPYGYSELLGDVVTGEAANQLINQISLPDYALLDDGTKISNTAPSKTVMRLGNTRAQTGAGNNPFYYQWLNMYAMNNACNTVLSVLPTVKFTGNAAVKLSTLQAWCYWWKGYAYASIGTLYYAGLVNDAPGSSNNKYLGTDSMMLASNAALDKAATALASVTSGTDYNSVLGKLIPSFCQVGNGGILTPAMWIRNINSMKARNLLLNKLSPFVNGNPAATITGSVMSTMTTADWQNILTLAGAGIQKGDFVFTGRSNAVNGFFTASGGSVAALTTGLNTGKTFKLSERLMQDFKPADKRLSNDFTDTVTYLNQVGGFTFSTRYSMVSGGFGASGVYVYGDNDIGANEVFIAVNYEETQLMLAEANIRLGKIDDGLAFVDAVRIYQGAGIPAVANTGLSLSQALQEFVMERRAALAFRGLSFYDARRWGWTYDISKGGGNYNAVVFTSSKKLNTHATINYDFLDYWDVPADESDLNPPGAGSSPIKNPN
jgi:starch-binding outer membrane protein, SusD/RagB family